MSAGVHVPLRFLRIALKKGIQTLRTALPRAQPTVAAKPLQQLQPAFARLPSSRPPKTLRQRISNRWFTTNARPARFTAPRSYAAPTNSVPRGMFASTLRPGVRGAIQRSPMGGARGFASAAAPAEVIANVAVGMRAFLLASAKQRRGGVEDVRERMRPGAPGAYVDFDLRPKISGGVLGSRFVAEVREECEFAAKNMQAVCAELEKLAGLGELEVGVVDGVVRVRFPGVGRQEVEYLCDEVGVGRGVVHEDEMWDVPAVHWSGMMHSSAVDYGDTDSEVAECFDYYDDGIVLDSPTYDMSPNLTDLEDEGSVYDGLEGVHRFLQECDSTYRYGLNY